MKEPSKAEYPRFAWERAIAETDLPPHARLVAWAVGFRFDREDGTSRPTLKTIGKNASLSRSAVQRNLDILEDAGWITRKKQGGHKADIYRIAVPIDVVVPDRDVLALAPFRGTTSDTPNNPREVSEEFRGTTGDTCEAPVVVPLEAPPVTHKQVSKQITEQVIEQPMHSPGENPPPKGISLEDWRVVKGVLNGVVSRISEKQGRALIADWKQLGAQPALCRLILKIDRIKGSRYLIDLLSANGYGKVDDQGNVLDEPIDHPARALFTRIRDYDSENFSHLPDSGKIDPIVADAIAIVAAAYEENMRAFGTRRSPALILDSGDNGNNHDKPVGD